MVNNEREIAQAINWFNNEQYNELIEFCQVRQQQHPMFCLLLATAYGKLERFELAEPLFLQLQGQYPKNLDVLFNYALILKMQHRIDDAHQQLQRCLQYNPRYHPAHHALGHLYVLKREYVLASRHYEQAISLQPGNCTYIYSVAELDYLLGNYDTARQRLTSVLAQIYHSGAMRLLSAVLYKLKLSHTMRLLCQQYQTQIQSEPDILMYAGLIELDEKCYVKAIKLLEQAKSQVAAPTFDIDANLLYCKFLLDPAQQFLVQIIKLTEHTATEEAYLFTANLLETLGKLDEAERITDNGLRGHPQATELQLIKAKILARTKRCNEALALLKTLDAAGNAGLQLEICYQKIQVHEAQSDYTLAAEQIVLAGKQSEAGDILDGLEKEVSRALQDLKTMPAVQGGSHKKLVFIVGFPRSGTTLLESRLARLNGIKILEETHAVKHFYHRLLQKSADNNVMSYLTTLNQDERALLSQEYLESLQQYVPLDGDDVIVDKMPLNAAFIVPMLLLFPDAKIILMLRHPMDVCISSLKQRMINLFSIDSFAQSYDCYFGLLMQLKNQFTDNVFVLKYEQLVTDYEMVFSSVLAHCQLPASSRRDSDKALASTAPEMFNTPSYHQVSKPLYTNAVGSYKHYQSLFDFQHPILMNWCERLGYAPD